MKILIVGDPIIDKYTYVDINRMSPEDSSIPVLDVVDEEFSLGGCLNVCSNLKSLDKKNEIWVSAPSSLWTQERLYENDIFCCEPAMFFESMGPSVDELTKERIINNKTKKQIARIDNRLIFQQTTIEKFKKAFSLVTVDNFDCIVISDYAKGCVGWFVVNKLKGLGCPIFVDTKQKDLSMWKDLDNIFLKINWKEFSEAEHTKQIKNLIVTHGEKPAQLRKYGQLVRQFEVRPIENPNVVGAGDIFLASIVVEYLKSENIEKSIEFAIETTAKSIGRKNENY